MPTIEEGANLNIWEVVFYFIWLLKVPLQDRNATDAKANVSLSLKPEDPAWDWRPKASQLVFQSWMIQIKRTYSSTKIGQYCIERGGGEWTAVQFTQIGRGRLTIDSPAVRVAILYFYLTLNKVRVAILYCHLTFERSKSKAIDHHWLISSESL